MSTHMETAVDQVLESLIDDFGKSSEDREKLFAYLEERVQKHREVPNLLKSPRKPVRLFLDGCFDIMHAGHFNAIRQAKALGDILVVGVHSDAEILRNKGPTTMTDEERLYAVKACKWVDEVVFDVPYSPSVDLLDRLGCDFVVHGDDMPTDADGNSAYAEVIKKGRLKLIKRTEGVSTTDLVGRMLLMTRDHHLPSEDSSAPQTLEDLPLVRAPSSSFLPTTRRIIQFATSRSKSRGRSTSLTMSNAKHIVYVDGNWDLFNAGHIELLEKAKTLGDFLLVGVHDDHSVNAYLGKNYPIMNLHERVLNVLSCKYVDEVILGAPPVVTHDLLVSMNIKVVVYNPYHSRASDEKFKAFDIARARNILVTVETERNITTETVVGRILTHHQRYEARNANRAKKEQEYFQGKQFVAEI